MEGIHSLETSLLMDMLVQYTASYMKMLKTGATREEYEKCNLTVMAIQAEINSRKMTTSNTSTTDPNIMLPVE